MIIAANICTFIGMSLLLYSTFSKNKETMLKIQFFDCLLNSLGNILIGSYSGMTTNAISGIRNILNAKNKNNVVINSIMIITMVIIGLIVNTKGIIGLLPIIASVQYSIWSYKIKSAQGLRYGLLLNIIIWLIHDFVVMLYTSAAIDCILIVTISYNIKKENGRL